MTIEDARKHIGHRVLYRLGAYANKGRITWAGGGTILVQLDGEHCPRALNPGGLTLTANPR
jgi:hypothetical protein